ncbi:MAG: hypothetical protein IT348_07775 [Candidatus Eisenbacteria bacterium]|nr:hypothetical protein [Candidatus Eisenbacteria bacterium]
MPDSHPNFPALPLQRLDGRLTFRDAGSALPFDLHDFWAWSGSDLIGNTQRGALAEYLVARALELDTPVRDEWNAWDLETASGLRIEVKCSGYVQAWAQKVLSRPSFGIARRAGWTRTIGEFSKRQARWSDLFVFALHDHRDQATIDPLDVGQWRFLVVPTPLLDERCGAQRTITASRLISLAGDWCGYREFAPTFEQVAVRMARPVRAPDDPGA